MADKATGKGPIEQEPKTTPDGANEKAPVDTGDRELSDADLDRVAGGANSEPLLPRRSGGGARAQ
jgi:hypothetical protein